MFFTVVRLAKRPKAKHILVSVESMVSGHRVSRIRERLAEKLEFIHFDPYVQQKVLYREKEKLRSVRFIKTNKYMKLNEPFPMM